MGIMNRQAHGGMSTRRLVNQAECPAPAGFQREHQSLGPSPAVANDRPRGELLSHYPIRPVGIYGRRWPRFGIVSPEEFLIGNGSTELIHLLPGPCRSGHLLVIGPTFSEYAAAMARVGGQISSIMATRDDGYRPPLEQALDDLDKFRNKNQHAPVDAVMLCNPNSQTGQACDAVMVRNWPAGWLVLDNGVSWMKPLPNVRAGLNSAGGPACARTLVLRSFASFTDCRVSVWAT